MDWSNAQIETSDELNSINAEFAQRHLEVLKTQSSHTSADEEKQLTNSYLMPASTNQPQKNHTSTISFVNASILSRLDLPTFDDNLLEYLGFFSRYSTVTSSKVKLDDITKLSLLKSRLRGRALQSSQRLALTATNYHISLDILKTQYDDKVTAQDILFSQLANVPSCYPEGRNIQSLYNIMFALTRQSCTRR
ncbi:hypothetical protein RB195_025466 [Necator americanus]|uniref:Uncharacterized protein n=1 Tax=Necator americanus TaxID=51031 RepID=A0ABR1ESE6_NECAM